MAKGSTSGPRRTTKKAAPAAATSAPAELDKHAPVSLPSGGSYEIGKLQSGLDKAADGKPEKRDDAVAAALKSAEGAGSTDVTAPNALPDHSVFKVTTDLGNGETVTELRQVPNPEASGDAVEADPNSLGTGRSAIVDAERVGSSPAPSAPAPTGNEGGATSDVDATVETIVEGDNAGEDAAA